MACLHGTRHDPGTKLFRRLLFRYNQSGTIRLHISSLSLTFSLSPPPSPRLHFLFQPREAVAVTCCAVWYPLFVRSFCCGCSLNALSAFAFLLVYHLAERCATSLDFPWSFGQLYKLTVIIIIISLSLTHTHTCARASSLFRTHARNYAPTPIHTHTHTLSLSLYLSYEHRPPPPTHTHTSFLLFFTLSLN